MNADKTKQARWPAGVVLDMAHRKHIGWLIREALLELRLGGLGLKEAAAVIGTSEKNAGGQWARIKRLCGGATDMAIAAWAAGTPKKSWGLDASGTVNIYSGP